MRNPFKHKESTPIQVPVTPAPTASEPTAPASDAVRSAMFWSGASLDEEMIRVEEKWQDDVLIVRAELPGVDPDRDIRLTVVDRHLVIEAGQSRRDTINRDGYFVEEQRSSAFTRSLPLRDGVDASSITGTYKDGVLEVRVPMPRAACADPEVRIPITT